MRVDGRARPSTEADGVVKYALLMLGCDGDRK